MTGALAILSLEGVLQAEGTGNPIPTGIALYRALGDRFTLALSFDQRTDVASAWCSQQGLLEHMYILPAGLSYSPAVNRIEQLRDARARGMHVELWVTGDPEAARFLMKEGVPTLLLGHPAYARPEHRPDHQEVLAPWDTYVAALNEDLERRKRDQRLASD